MKYLKAFSLNLILAAAFVLMGAATPPEDLTFDDFDKNDNLVIERSEFMKVFTNHYIDDWNTTNNDYLDDEDFNHTIYGVWDENHDQKLSPMEWGAAHENYFSDYIVVEFEDIDVNDDGSIVYSEYYDVVKTSKFFDDWDFDGDDLISNNELARGVFNNWDIDSSGFLDRGEYNRFDLNYLDI